MRSRVSSTKAHIFPDKLKEFFSRANDIEYFPDEDNGRQFKLHVKAYSEVSPGLRFSIDLDAKNGEGSVDIIGEAKLEELGIEESEEEVEQEDIFLDEKTSEWEELLVEPQETVGIKASADRWLRSTNGIKDYWVADMVTGVKVEKFLPLGKVGPTKKTARKRESRVGELDTSGGRRNIITFGIDYLLSEQYQMQVRHAMNEKILEFVSAKGYEVPKEFKRNVGWARRAPQGFMYGKKYIDRYKHILEKWYQQGVENSDEKKGPSEMLDKLRQEFPDVYTLPSVLEIQSFISQRFAKEKKEKGGTVTVGNANIDDENDESIGEEYVDAVQEIVRKYGGEIKPQWVYVKFRKKFKGRQGIPEKKLITKVATKLSTKLKKERKRCLIG